MAAPIFFKFKNKIQMQDLQKIQDAVNAITATIYRLDLSDDNIQKLKGLIHDANGAIYKADKNIQAIQQNAFKLANSLS